MELKREGLSLLSDTNKADESDEIEIELYKDLAAYSNLSPEEQKAYLERFANSAFKQAVKASSPAEARSGNLGSEQTPAKSVGEAGGEGSASKRPSGPLVSSVSLKSLPGSSPDNPSSANIVVRASDQLSSGALDEDGDTKMMIDTSTWFSDDDSIDEITTEAIRPVPVQVEEIPSESKTDTPELMKRTTGSLVDKSVKEMGGVISFVICRECNSPSDSGEMYCAGCGAFLVEKETVEGE